MMPDFIAIDFETATRNMNSACSVGIALVRDGQVADTFYSLIQPPGNSYDPQNTFIHGISADDTLTAPDFEHVWYEIEKYFGPYPVLAHNANFDMSVLAMCCNDNAVTCAEIALACLRHSGEDNLLQFCFQTPHVMIYNFADLHPMQTFHSSKDRQHYRKFSAILKPGDISPQSTSFDTGNPMEPLKKADIPEWVSSKRRNQPEISRFQKGLSIYSP